MIADWCFLGNNRKEAEMSKQKKGSAYWQIPLNVLVAGAGFEPTTSGL